jgi:amino acid transporter
MFSQGQLIFAAVFAVAFIIISVVVYRKDAKLHSKVYKGSYKVLIAFLLFIAFLFVVKTFLKR